MSKKSAVHLPILFYVVFLWGIAGGSCCFSGEGGTLSTLTSSSVPSVSMFSQPAGNDNRPTDHNTIGNFSDVSLPSACLNGETNGSRQLSSMQGRLILLVRLAGGNAYAVRGGFGRVNEIRASYGWVRPHLYFCRLLI